jgi:hypothetical protein
MSRAGGQKRRNRYLTEPGCVAFASSCRTPPHREGSTQQKSVSANSTEINPRNSCIDNRNQSLGTFYEGAMVSGYPSDATENAVQANIIAACYR